MDALIARDLARRGPDGLPPLDPDFVCPLGPRCADPVTHRAVRLIEDQLGARVVEVE